MRVQTQAFAKLVGDRDFTFYLTELSTTIGRATKNAAKQARIMLTGSKSLYVSSILNRRMSAQPNILHGLHFDFDR